MARMLDANQKFTGTEPKFSTELSQMDLSKALSWYSQNKDSKDSQKYASDYFKKKFKMNISDATKSKPPTFGFMCRIILNGGILSQKDQEWFDSEIEDVKKKVSSKSATEDKTTKVNVPNIQDRIREKASECVGELEGLIDILIDSRFTENVSPYSVMHTSEIKGVHTKYVVDRFKKVRAEYDSVINTADPEIKEGYSNFKKTDLKKLITFCDQVILDANKISGEAVKSRKPRKRKVKTVEQLTAKVKICQEFKELNLTSIDIKSIIGTMQLWVYNTKTRKLGVYHASDAGGLSIKGSTLQNYSEDKSIQKKLRKPEVTLPEILKGGKVYLRNAIDGVKAVASPLSGRLNEDTILLRIVK